MEPLTVRMQVLKHANRIGGGLGRFGFRTGWRQLESVTGAMHGVNPAGLGGVDLDLLAEADDVFVHRSRRGKGRDSPDAIEEILPRHHLPGPFDQQGQHGEFAGGQREFLVTAQGPTGGEVHGDVAEQDAWRCLGCGVVAAKQGSDAGQEFVATERFRQVVVGAGIQALDAVFDPAAGGEDEDATSESEAAKLPADGKAIQLGKHEIEQHQIRLLVECARQSIGAIGTGQHTVAPTFQAVGEDGAHAEFVFHDENAFKVGGR